MTTAGNLDLRASDLDIYLTALSAGTSNLPGTLTLTVTNRLSDGSFYDLSSQSWVLTGNAWDVTAGFDVSRRPASGNLIGTTIRSSLGNFGIATHTWPAADLGGSLRGYSNNLALGKLVLDGKKNNTFFFQGPDTTANYALYVDYLELLDDATNYTRALSIAPNFTLYFAGANIPPRKLDGAAGGRLVWVHDPWFYGQAGPYSGTNFVYVRTNSYGLVTTNVYTFNRGEVEDQDFDSNYNGVVNPLDPEPLFTPADIDLVVGQVPVGLPPVLTTELSWVALAFSTNRLYYSTNATLPGETWTLFTNFVNGPFTERVSVLDPNTDSPVRMYQVQEDPQWPPMW